MRKLRNWLEGFLDLTEGIQSPARFRSWAGMSAIATALERKVWVHIKDMDLYPNLYIMLVGPPASGKSLACSAARNVVRRVSTIRLAPSDVTQASFYDALEESSRVMPIKDKAPLVHHSMSAMVGEIGQFIKPGDINFINTLTDVYDCIEVFEKRRRSTEDNTIQNIWFNMLACSTTRYLGEVFTPTVLEQGLPSRFVLVYCDRNIESVRVPLFREEKEAKLRREKKTDMMNLLYHDLEEIHQIQGEMVFDSEAEKGLQAWVDDGMLPMPLDSRFEYYCDRRVVHLAKLCMVASAMRTDDRIITYDDFYFAKQALLGAEQYMPSAIESLGGNQLYTQMQSVVKFIEASFTRDNKPVPEHVIRQRLNRDVPLNMLDAVLESLIASKEIEADGNGKVRFFTPRKVN